MFPLCIEGRAKEISDGLWRTTRQVEGVVRDQLPHAAAMRDQFLLRLDGAASSLAKLIEQVHSAQDYVRKL